MFNTFLIEERSYAGYTHFVPFRLIFGIKFAILKKRYLSLLDSGEIYPYVIDAYNVIEEYGYRNGVVPMEITFKKNNL